MPLRGYTPPRTGRRIYVRMGAALHSCVSLPSASHLSDDDLVVYLLVSLDFVYC
jgi:hypothetical protein